MNEKLKKLFEEIKFPCGAVVDSRFVMAPMVVGGSSYEGNVGEDDIRYFERRADTASLLISGAASVTPDGNAFEFGLGIYADSQIDGLKKMAEAMKSKGNKALVQIFHPGYAAGFTYRDKGVVYGVSDVEVGFIDYPVTPMSRDQIEEAIGQFVRATQYAMEAGFDGVEIHGANHYLIQQFFSKTTNKRTDEFGGTVENRERFALETVKRIRRYVKESGRKDFIVGYRISPEEIHGEDIGYTLEDSLHLINEIVKLGVDYIHTSLRGERAYAARASSGMYKGQEINRVIKKSINGAVPLMGAGDITSFEKMLEALEYLDLIAMASLALIDPDAKNKVKEGRENEISLLIKKEGLKGLALPKTFPSRVVSVEKTVTVPRETIELLREGGY